MGRSQREKGKRGEREWREYLEASGIADAKRTGWKQSDGGDEPDVVHGMFAAEVKRHKKFWPEKVYSALHQADNTHSGVPYLAARGDNQPWLVAMYAKDFVKLAALYDAYHLAERIANSLDDLRAFLANAELGLVTNDSFYASSNGVNVSVQWAVADDVAVTVMVDGYYFMVRKWHKADWNELFDTTMKVGDGVE